MPRSGPDPKAAGGAHAFKASTLSGQDVDFPAGYRGKIVLLDFWATWCGPCQGEIPHLVQAYGEFRKQGFEIVGVTLDTGPTSNVKRFLGQKGMTWEQIQASGQQIATSYGVTSIPAAFLVDGDTGAILAQGDELRGEALLKTIEKHLKDRGR